MGGGGGGGGGRATETFIVYWTSVFTMSQCYSIIMFWDLISAPYLRPVAIETKTADAQVKYKRVDLQSYEARNGASLARS